MADVQNNIENTVTLDATKLHQLNNDKRQSGGTTQGGTRKKRCLQNYRAKRHAVSQKLSQKKRTQIKGNEIPRHGGLRITQTQKKNIMICLDITGLMVIKLMWVITTGRDALLVLITIIRKQKHRATRWEAARGTKIGSRTDGSMGRLEKGYH